MNSVSVKSDHAPLKELMQKPGVGKSIAQDLINIGITKVNQLRGKNPELLYEQSQRDAVGIKPLRGRNSGQVCVLCFPMRSLFCFSNKTQS